VKKNADILLFELVFKIKSNEILSKNKTLTTKSHYIFRTELQCNSSSSTCTFLLAYQCQSRVVRWTWQIFFCET